METAQCDSSETLTDHISNKAVTNISLNKALGSKNIRTNACLYVNNKVIFEGIEI